MRASFFRHTFAPAFGFCASTAAFNHFDAHRTRHCSPCRSTDKRRRADHCTFSVQCASIASKAAKKFDILAVGNPTVDRTIESTAEDIRRAGLEVDSETAGLDPALKARALAAVKAMGASDATTAGGAALNTTRVASGRFEARAAFLGCVGADADGNLLRKAASDAGVLWLIPPIAGDTTGECAVVVEKQSRQRTLVVVRGAAGSLKPDHLQTNSIQEALYSSEISYATAFVLSTPLRAVVVKQMAKAAVESDGVFALNLSSAGLQTKVASHILELLPHTTLLFGNEKEWAAFGEVTGLNGADDGVHAAVAARLAPGGCAIMTQGKDPTIVVNTAQRFEFLVPEIPKKEIVDTNCAGDSFVAGFLAAYAKKASLDVCVAQGHKASGQTLRMRGC